MSEHHAYGGKGAKDLAVAVIAATAQKRDFKYALHF